MSPDAPAIAINHLIRRFGHTDAVDGLSLRVEPGRCYGFFGRNGAGKTTTIKCLLNLLRPTGGSVEVFGMNPARHEVAVKRRLSYVPDQVGFYPWMTVRDTLEYAKSFRSHWNDDTQRSLVDRFRLDLTQKTSHLSKGQKTQVALVAAICPEPDLLVLDEPTSGLDPIVRREFIQTVIGAYQEGAPGQRTVFVSTHLISEFEGLIDEFTIIDAGKAVLTMEADAARQRFQKVYARFASEPSGFAIDGARVIRQRGREIEFVVTGRSEDVMSRLAAASPEAIEAEALSLEEIFVTTLTPDAGPVRHSREAAKAEGAVA
jgi:ABC-2 type transport system ATP-binding protein